jgi:TM2 domain-containing membrane protein YozV
VLSLVIPGAGQMYKGKLGLGFAFLVGTIMGYMLLLVPGLIVHVFAIVNAYSGSVD